jgi:methionine-rich copper-binding protein CopC
MNPIQSKSLPALAAALAAVVLTTIPARGAPWTPAELSQPSALWLDASDSGTITLSGSAVSQWNDKSGNSRNFAQATGGNQPAYSATSFNTSYPGVTFDGSSDFMSAGDTLDVGSQSLGIIAAVKYNTSNTSGMVISKTRYAAGDGRYFMGRFQGTGFGLGSGTQYQYVAESDFASAISPSADSSTSPRLLGLDLNRQTSGSIKNWIDGVAVKTSTFTGNATAYNSNDLLLLGAYGNPTGTGPQASSYLSGVISEVVVVQTAMSDTDRQKLEGYLAWKWGMQASLPVGHPYESAAPESDTTPPTIATRNPADDASGVLTYANLSATFDEVIQKGTGNITLKKTAGNLTVETFDVATSPRITVSGATLTIDPTGYLASTTDYYVEIDATAVKDTVNNFFAGIADATTWNFTTGVADTTAPTIATLSPADDATDVAVEANLVATFDENIQKGTGFITLKKTADNSEVETFDVATSPRITVSGATLTIDPTANLAVVTGYYVQIAPAAIQDLSGNSFAGIADSTTWNFTAASSFTIPVLNPSFQSNVVADGAIDLFADNWTLGVFTPSSGRVTWNPNGFFTGDGGNGTPLGADQSQVFTIYGGDSSSGGRIHQDTTTPLTASTTYTLTVAVGRRLSGDAASWGIDLMTTSQTPGSQYLARLTGTYTDLTAGQFVDKVVTFTATAGHPNLGQNLRIHMWSQGIDGSHTSTAFDNVRLGAAADTTPPVIATLSPATGAIDVLTYANLAATFDEFVQKGTGNITLKKSAGNLTVETFDVATSPRITVSGATLTIDPTGYLEGTTGYYVEIDATAVKDMANNSFAGIADTTTWNFTTGVADTTAPTIATLSPADGATGVAEVDNLVATFGEPVQAGSGFITIKQSSDDTTVEAFDVASSAQLTFGGTSVTINPTSDLAAGTGYYVQIDPTAIQDLSGNSFAGIADSTTWNFTTITSGGYAAWQTTNGTAGTIDQDHDADGVPNGIEYFLFGNTDTTGFTALPPVSNNSGVLSVTWTKAADYAGNYGPAADFVVQTSDTLTSWSPASTSGTPNTPDTVYLNGNDVTYTFPSPLDAKKFARLVVTGP